MGNNNETGNEVVYDKQQELLLYLKDIVFFFVITILVFLMCFRIVVVEGDSMYDTLIDGDYLILTSNLLSSEPKAGDIVVVSKESFDNGNPIVKRVIAVEGQTVDIDFEKGIVYVDGVAIDEPYIHTATTNNGGTSFPLTVREGCIFVMGDNRGRSRDSRYPELGQIDTREVLGKAFLIAFPGNDEGALERDFSRIGAIS